MDESHEPPTSLSRISETDSENCQDGFLGKLINQKRKDRNLFEKNIENAKEICVERAITEYSNFIKSSKGFKTFNALKYWVFFINKFKKIIFILRLIAQIRFASYEKLRWKFYRFLRVQQFKSVRLAMLAMLSSREKIELELNF